MTHDPRFDEWLATPAQTGRLVEGVYFYGNAWAGSLRFANSIFSPAMLPDHLGNTWEWMPADFRAALPERQESLQLQMTLTFNGITPELISAFDRMPPEYLSGTSFVQLFTWIVPDAADVPMVVPPPRYAITQLDMSGAAFELTCSGPLLPNWRAGRVYTIEEFPGLSTE